MRKNSQFWFSVRIITREIDLEIKSKYHVPTVLNFWNQTLYDDTRQNFVQLQCIRFFDFRLCDPVMRSKLKTSNGYIVLISQTTDLKFRKIMLDESAHDWSKWDFQVIPRWPYKMTRVSVGSFVRSFVRSLVRSYVRTSVRLQTSTFFVSQPTFRIRLSWNLVGCYWLQSAQSFRAGYFDFSLEDAPLKIFKSIQAHSSYPIELKLGRMIQDIGAGFFDFL